MNRTLISIQGPTATGKTQLAIDLSKQIDIEIISADSRQFYREMKIGTAKPAEEDQRKIPHHFISFLSVKDSYSASQFEKEALEVIENIFNRKKIPVLVGGSGLYAQAVICGFDTIPDVPAPLRESIIARYTQEGLDALLDELKAEDPEFYNIVDKKNFRRVLRAIEVIRASGKPYSFFRKNQLPQRNFDTIRLALYFPRDILYQRINQRCRQMLKAGLLDEATKLYPLRHLPALQTIGYQEFFDYLDHKYSLDEAIEKFMQHSRNYAKKQLSWLKRDDDIVWFQGDQAEESLTFIKNIFS